MKYLEFKNVVIKKVDSSANSDELVACLNEAIISFPKNEVSYRKAFFSVVKDVYQLMALKEVDPLIDKLTDLKFLTSIKIRVEKALRAGQEGVRGQYKKILLRDIELNFTILVEEGKIDSGLSLLDRNLKQHPYLARTAYKRLAKKYAGNNDRLHDYFSSSIK